MTGRALTPPPAIVVRFELEAAPKVVANWMSEADEMRIRDWLHNRPDYLGLIRQACELAERERTA